MVSDGSNKKKLYSFVKNKKCDSSGVASLKKDGNTVGDAKGKAEVLNSQFSSVFTEEGDSPFPNLGTSSTPDAPNIQVGRNGVMKLLRGLKPHKATGPDKISSLFLKEMASPITPALTLIYQASLEQGQIPDEWKTANVAPIFKKGDKSKPSYYRPVSLTSICCKIVEHILHSHIMKCIDPRDLNNAIQREHYPMKTIEEVVAEMPNAKVFTKLDVTSGFWQLKLTEESSKLTTFNTPFGRYRFRRAPFRIKSIPEIYQKCMVEMLEDIPGVEVIVDDILVWGSTIQEHDERLKMTLDRIRENNVKLSENKCQYRKDKIDYVGHTVCQQGLKASEEKIQATRNMKQPQSKKGVTNLFRIYHIFAKVLSTYVRNKCAFETIVRK